MPVVPADLARLLAAGTNGTLATLGRDGRPQLSVVTYSWYPENPEHLEHPEHPEDPEDAGRALVRISSVDGRTKVANLRRDPRASFIVQEDNGWSYAVVEGRVELAPVAAASDDATVDELVEVYRDAVGEHPDWDEYRQAMVADRRLVVRLVVDHAYGTARS